MLIHRYLPHIVLITRRLRHLLGSECAYSGFKFCSLPSVHFGVYSASHLLIFLMGVCEDAVYWSPLNEKVDLEDIFGPAVLMLWGGINTSQGPHNIQHPSDPSIGRAQTALDGAATSSLR